MADTTQVVEHLSWHEARSMSPVERLWHYTVEDEDGCVLWAGALNTQTGRPVFQADGKTHCGYVWLWEQTMERPVREGYELHHQCGKKTCVRPACLREMTVEEHTAAHGGGRGGALINAAKTHCKNNHPLEGDNLWVEQNGARHCKACRAEAARRFRARKKEQG